MFTSDKTVTYMYFILKGGFRDVFSSVVDHSKTTNTYSCWYLAVKFPPVVNEHKALLIWKNVLLLLEVRSNNLIK